jgi:hypothetical protein
VKTSIVQLRYKMKEVLKALDLRENVGILYHGKLKGTIIPTHKKSDKSLKDHPFFGMSRGSKKSVEEEMEELRKSRHNDI